MNTKNEISKNDQFIRFLYMKGRLLSNQKYNTQIFANTGNCHLLCISKYFFMSNPAQSLETLHDIKRMMERSSRFISLSGWSGIAAGACALVGAGLAHQRIVQMIRQEEAQDAPIPAIHANA